MDPPDHQEGRQHRAPSEGFEVDPPETPRESVKRILREWMVVSGSKLSIAVALPLLKNPCHL